LSVFEDPALTAQAASVFWDRGIASHVVSAHLSETPDGFGRTAPIILADLPCDQTVFEAHGVTHLLLRRRAIRVQLAVHGLVDVTRPLHVSLLLESSARLIHAARAMHQLDALRDVLAAPVEGPPVQFDGHLHDYLIALDAHLAGLSYREIAQILYGADIVKDVWTSETRYLKDKVRRCVQRGLALRDGGYRTLLA
jgi:hypothetical protein